MVKIYIPSSYFIERKYVIDTMLGNYLGIRYRIIPIEKEFDYSIKLPNNNTLIIKDYFFSSKINKYGYLTEESIPEKVFFGTNRFITENNIPVIYGKDLETIILTENNSVNKKIICHIDIFASSFYMLTRWEEYVIKERDDHNRFSYHKSLAARNDFLHRPVVNEYTEMLYNMLVFLDIDQIRIKRDFDVFITHDIDLIRYKPKLREFIGDIIKRNSLSAFFNRIWYSLFSNPFNTFSFLMDQCETIGRKSVFYFMAGKRSKFDYDNYLGTRLFFKITNQIKIRNHQIGFHPSFLSYNKKHFFREEKETLENALRLCITEGRQHYLRFEIPTTWRIWNDLGLDYDSSMAYPKKQGFRCGTCYEFKVFDILARKQLSITERPLIAMDTTLVSHQKMTPFEAEETIISLINKVKKYNGCFVFLWHNSSFNIHPWNKYKKVYINTINYLGKVLEMDNN